MLCAFESFKEKQKDAPLWRLSLVLPVVFFLPCVLSLIYCSITIQTNYQSKMRQSGSTDSKPETYQGNAKICRLVELYPCMYDRSHIHYMKKDVLDKAWDQISKEAGEDVAVCKSRWRNIRTSFARSININKVPSIANRTKPYYLHKELQFLARHITPGIPVSRRSRRSEKIEVSIGEESFDGLAATAAQDYEEYDEQCTDEEESQQGHASNSSLDEGTMSSKGGEQMAQSHSPQETQADAKRQELPEQNSPLPLLQHQYIHQQPPQQQQLQPEPAPPLQQQPSPPPALPLESTTEEEGGTVGEVTLPMYPFKKRLRTVIEPMMCVEVEQEPDVKHQRNELCTADSNFDAAFLQGLLPEMKAMDFRQKIIFKKRIYEVIGEIFESTPNTNAATRRPSQPNPAYNGNASIASSNSRPLSNGYATNHMNGSTVNNKRRSSIRTPTPATSPSASGYISPLNTLNNASSPAPTTVVNATDLAMLRRLSSLLQSPTVTPSSSNSAMTALPKNVVSITSAVCPTTNTLTTASQLSPATVSVHRGAMTRSSSNFVRTSMVNGMALPTSTVSGSSSATPATSQAVKQELLDD